MQYLDKQQNILLMICIKPKLKKYTYIFSIFMYKNNIILKTKLHNARLRVWVFFPFTLKLELFSAKIVLQHLYLDNPERLSLISKTFLETFSHVLQIEIKSGHVVTFPPFIVIFALLSRKMSSLMKVSRNSHICPRTCVLKWQVMLPR